MQKSEKKRILVVEDEKHIAEGLNLNLSLQGYDVQIAGNGISGLRQWKEWQPDLIVLDIMLPGRSGLDLLRHLRERDQDAGVLLITARDATEDVVEAFRAGANDYVTKPLDFPVVLARIESQLTLKRQKGEIQRLVQDLELPVEILGGAIVREPDGLAIIPWYTNIDGGLDWCQPAEANPDTAAAERFFMLNYAIDKIKAQPNTHVYLDGTHSA